MFALLGRTLATVKPLQSCRMISTTAVNPAARKGTREKARSKKVKVETQKVGFIPHNQRDQSKLTMKRANKHIDDSMMAVSPDNVVIGKYYRWRVYTIAEAIQCHRETHHPTMFGKPDAPIVARIELLTQAEKKTRFVENFYRTAMIPHKYDHGEERTILVLVKGQDLVQEAQRAGATLAGGAEIIKEIQNGKINLADYEYVLAHPNMMADLAVLRGLMKKGKFPNPKSGTMGPDITEMVERYLNGIQYRLQKDEYQKDFGLIETPFGTLDMPTEHLEANLVALLKDVDSMRPKRDGKFITRCILKSPPSGEQLKIDPFLHVKEDYVKTGGKGRKEEAVEDDNDEDGDADEAATKKEATN